MASPQGHCVLAWWRERESQFTCQFLCVLKQPGVQRYSFRAVVPVYKTKYTHITYKSFIHNYTHKPVLTIAPWTWDSVLVFIIVIWVPFSLCIVIIGSQLWRFYITPWCLWDLCLRELMRVHCSSECHYFFWRHAMGWCHVCIRQIYSPRWNTWRSNAFISML